MEVEGVRIVVFFRGGGVGVRVLATCVTVIVGGLKNLAGIHVFHLVFVDVFLFCLFYSCFCIFIFYFANNGVFFSWWCRRQP